MIESTRTGGVAVLRMVHGKANAFDTDLMRALRGAIDEVARSTARSLVLTGNGAIFSAGVDLFKLLDGGRSYLAEFLPELSACLKTLFTFPKPAVAAVNGHAIAGGCLLACACDHRLMASGQGRIGVPELRVGVPFPLVALEIVRFALPAHVANEVVVLGRTYGVTEAVARGLVDAAVDPERLRERAVATAEEMGAAPASAFARSKLDLRRPALETWAARAADHDRATLEAWASAEVQGAVRAYVERTLRK